MLKKQITEEQNWSQNAYVREIMMTSKPKLEKNKTSECILIIAFLKLILIWFMETKYPPQGTHDS